MNCPLQDQDRSHRGRAAAMVLLMGLAAICLPGLALGQDASTRPGQLNPPALPSTTPRHSGGFASGRLAPAPTTPVPAPNPTTWTAVGPGPLNSPSTVSGRLAGVALDPVDGSIYVAAAGGGVWKSTDGGATYTPLTDTQSTLAMGAIAIAPSNHLTIYAGTGESNNSADSNFGAGILVSHNGGTTWTLSNGGGIFYRRTVGKIAVSPVTDQVAYAAVGDFGENGLCCSGTGIYKTTDGGTTWTNVTAAVGLDSTYPWSDVVVDPNTPTTVYAAYGAYFGYAANGVYRSLDSGATWTLLSGAGSGSALGRIALAVAPSASTSGQHVLYVAVSSPTTYGLYQMLRSGNADAAAPVFANLTSTPNFGGSQGWYDWVIGVDPSDANNVYAAGVGYGSKHVVRSTNGGTTWIDLTTVGGVTPHTDSHAMAFDASHRLLLGNDGGIWRYDPAVPSWTNLNGNLNTIQFMGIGLHPTNAQTIVGGSQDNGTELTTGNLEWTETDGGDGGFTQISQTNGLVCYGNHPIASFGTSSFFRVSTDGCNTWVSRTPAISNSGAFNFYAPIFVDPSNGSRVFLGGDKLYESTNTASSWVGHTSPSSNPIDTIAVLPGGNTIYVATGGTFATSSNVYVSTNDGTSWTAVNLPVGGRVNELDVDPNDLTGATVVAAISTFNAPGGQVYRTVNGGVSWTNITANLPAVPTWSAKIDTDASRTIYVSNETGVYSSPSPYSTWSVMGSGLPHAQGLDLELNSSLHLLAVATHGRGAWYLSTKGTQTITFTTNPPPTAAYNSNFTVAATASSGLAVAFSSSGACTNAGALYTMTSGTGTCSVIANQPGNATYYAAPQVTQSTTASLVAQTITFGALANKPMGTPPFAVTATASSGLPVSFTSGTPAVCTVSGNIVTLLKGGSCSLTASQAGNSNYAAATPVTHGFQVTIGTTPQTITFNPLPSQPVNAPPFIVSATASSGLAVSFSSNTPAICTVAGSTVTLVAGGTCTIKASQPGNGVYAAATPVTQSFTVTKLAQTITFAALPSKPLNAPPFTVSATASSGLPVSFLAGGASGCTVSGNTVTLVATGTCSITAKQAGNGTYAAASAVTQSFQVTKLAQTITFGALPSKPLNSPPFTVSATASSGLAVSFSASGASGCTVSGATVTLVNTGTCSITATQPGNASYAAAKAVTQSFQVTRLAQTITFGALPNKPVNTPPFTVSATASSGLAVSFSASGASGCTVSGNTVTLVTTGTCSITATQAGNANYLAAPAVTQSFQVTKLTQTISFAPLSSRALGSSPFTVSATASSGLAVSFASNTPATCTVSGSTVTLVTTGGCSIKATQPGNATYAAATPVSQSFGITP
jgi:hypothetical protein